MHEGQVITNGVWVWDAIKWIEMVGVITNGIREPVR